MMMMMLMMKMVMMRMMMMVVLLIAVSINDYKSNTAIEGTQDYHQLTRMSLYPHRSTIAARLAPEENGSTTTTAPIEGG